MQKTELKGGISLSLSLILSLCNIHKLAQVMNGHLNIAVFSMHVSQQLVCLALLVARASLHLTLADFEESGQACDSLVQVTKLLMDETDALVAFGLLLLLVGTLTGLQALLEIL